ncbi:MAG TPA: riboflavin synthase [Tepidisphaeraceae bacterium]|jgi:riboflavin synthase
MHDGQRTLVFTGIIHKTAKVLGVSDHAGSRRITLVALDANHVLGESIAVNGVCLTVAAIDPADGSLAFDVIRETLDRTNLGELRPGDEVHTERSLRVGDPIDGHFVQGHVDGTGRLLNQTDSDQEVRLRIQAPAHLAKYLVPKGSLAIDGVSLTLAKIDGDQFEVALIPTTIQLTTLAKKQVNYPFNLEFDSIAKTIISYLERIHPQADDARDKER